jgi:small conductance mechanosensitive channel
MAMTLWLPWIWLALTIFGLLLGGYLLMKLFRLEMRAIIRRAADQAESEAALRQRVEDLARGVRPAVAFIVLLLATFFILRALGHPAAVAWNPESVLDWLLTRGLRIVLLLAGAFVVNRIVRVVASNIARLIRAHDNTAAAEMERQKRAQTVSSIIERFSGVVVAVVTGLMILSELGINTTPILTGLGVVGVALGLGAQQLVGDLIAGFFHIFENQIRVGDVATINGTSGLVQELRLRTTLLRGGDGTVYVFRNGTINTLANMTKDFSYFSMDLTVPFQQDTDRVTKILKEVGAELLSEPEFKPSILEPLEVLGIDRFTDTAVILQVRMKTHPSKQWEVGREFRRRLKYRLQKEKIDLTISPAPLPPITYSGSPGPASS